jgi:hypothetical protein
MPQATNGVLMFYLVELEEELEMSEEERTTHLGSTS